MTKQPVKKARKEPPQRAPRQSLVPLRQAQDIEPIALETTFLEESNHHRWLLTTCIAGIATTLLVGGVALGIFGQAAVPKGANAAIQANVEHSTGGKAVVGTNLQNATAIPVDEPKKIEAKLEVLPERELSGEWAYPEITNDELAYSEDTAVLDAEIEAAGEESGNITTLSKEAPPEPVDETFKLAKGGSITKELINRGASKAAATALVKALEPIMPLTQIKAGTEFEVTFDRQYDFYGREVIFPVELTFKPGPKETIIVEADEDGRFDARIEGKKDGEKSQYAAKPESLHFRSKGKIGSSLYATAKDSRVPDYIVGEFTRVFSYDVDFQHQIAASDTYEMFFGKPLSGSSSKRKVLHYAKLNFDGKSKEYFRFTSSDGTTGYYDEQGRSASRALLKTPVPGARLTSGFGMRKHPLLRYSKMHTGVDFGAPTGTPIRASGAGVIDLAGRHGAYGITIVMKHGEKYKTLYAHMSKLAAGIRKGSRVNQGQVIGYVGTTGRSTGPHLHYEVRVDNRPVNPTAIKATGGKQLAGKDLQRFRQNKQNVLAMMQQAPSSTQVAQAGQ